MHKDKQPLVIPYTGDWYGDVKEHFKLMAENYFNPDECSIRKTDWLYSFATNGGIAQRERKENSTSTRTAKKAKSRMLTGAEDYFVPETESSATAVGSELEPVSVKYALFAETNTVLTSHGIIARKGKSLRNGQGRNLRMHEVPSTTVHSI